MRSATSWMEFVTDRQRTELRHSLCSSGSCHGYRHCRIMLPWHSSQKEHKIVGALRLSYALWLLFSCSGWEVGRLGLNPLRLRAALVLHLTLGWIFSLLVSFICDDHIIFGRGKILVCILDILCTGDRNLSATLPNLCTWPFLHTCKPPVWHPRNQQVNKNSA